MLTCAQSMLINHCTNRKNRILTMNTKYISFAALTIAMSLSTSCSDQPDRYEVKGGIPSVSYIRCLSSEVVGNNDDENTQYTNGQIVTQASPESVLCLVGDNLCSVTGIEFNKVKAVLNSSYMTDNTLIVSVPASIPEEVNDEIWLITQNADTVKVDFHVVISAPTITSISCEYAPIGSAAKIVGRYMIDDPGVPLSVNFTGVSGLIPATISKIAPDYTSVDITIPEGAIEGPIYVTSVYGTTKSNFRYLDSRGLLFDFDGATGLGNHGWHARDIMSDETSLTGNFLLLGGATLDADASWNDGNFSFEYWPGNWEDPETFSDPSSRLLSDFADFKDYENMSLKFEMFIPSSNPWSAGAMQIIPTSATVVSNGNAGTADIYGRVLGGANNHFISSDDGSSVPRALYRPWVTSGSFDTADQWITVTIPMNSGTFSYVADGTQASGSYGADSWEGLTIFVCSGGVTGTECAPIIKIDNIRAVPNK